MIAAHDTLDERQFMARVVAGLEARAAERWAKAGTLTGSAAETQRRNARDIAGIADQLRGDFAALMQPAALVAVAAE